MSATLISIYESGVAELYRICFHHVTSSSARKLEVMASKNTGNSSRPDMPMSRYPGERLGLPEEGPRSVARVGRRFVAITLDWIISALVLIVMTGRDYLSISSSASGQLQLLGVFVLLQILSIWAIGGSIGHRLLRIYVVNIHGGSLTWWRPIVRSVMLALVVPALVWDSDQRGFHDKIAGTLLLKS